MREYNPEIAVAPGVPEWLRVFCHLNKLICFQAAGDIGQWCINDTYLGVWNPIYVGKTLSQQAFIEIHARHFI